MDSTKQSAQKQFNECVKENIYELGMDEDEAVELAVEQLVSEEVNLSDIIPDVWVVKQEDPISVFCDKYNQIPLATTIGNGFNVSECLDKMNCATEMASKRLNYKLYAVDCMMDVIILSLAKMKNADEKIIRACLECLAQLCSGYPDLLKEETVDWLLEIYGGSNDAIKCLVLDLLKKGCAAHENNKHMVFSKTGLIATLRAIVDSGSAELLAPALGIICNLAKDDDARSESSEPHHQRAAALAEGILCKVYDMVKHPQPLAMKTLLLETLASVTVTDHSALEVFCHDDEFSTIEYLLKGTDDKSHLVLTLEFLIELCRHDEPKSAMRPLIPLITTKINHFQKCPHVIQTAFLLMSEMASKNKDNAMTLITCNAVDIVLQGMKAHEQSLMVRQNGGLALQNMASSSRYLQPFQKLGVREFITEMMDNDRTNTLAHVCKGVLVSLGVQPELEDLGPEHSDTS